MLLLLPPWSCRVLAWHLNAFWRGPGQSCSFPHLHYWSGTDSCWRASQRAGRCGETSGLHIYISLSDWFHTRWTDIARSHGAWNCCRSWPKTQPKPQSLKQALKWKAWQRRANTWGSWLFAKACDFNSIASPRWLFFSLQLSSCSFLVDPRRQGSDRSILHEIRIFKAFGNDGERCDLDRWMTRLTSHRLHSQCAAFFLAFERLLRLVVYHLQVAGHSTRHERSRHSSSFFQKHFSCMDVSVEVGLTGSHASRRNQLEPNFVTCRYVRQDSGKSSAKVNEFLDLSIFAVLWCIVIDDQLQIARFFQAADMVALKCTVLRWLSSLGKELKWIRVKLSINLPYIYIYIRMWYIYI